MSEKRLAEEFMKKNIGLLIFFLWPGLCPSLSYGAAPVPSPQGALLCLAGKVQGQEGGSACAIYTRDFFNIWVPGRQPCSIFATLVARYNYLKSEKINIPDESDLNAHFYVPVIKAYGECVDMPAFPEPVRE